ncbi:hypothetical protein AGMMS50239_25770 [Bacteroidia bacterium]|nr:hypothetical protein FACS1894207_0390 [Bacteroidia bacterium]GHT65607.1 hypothetical protein AGMMS50239_25770 [Bacteroidia bacterium]
MHLISNNPYRVLGVLADATVREIIRQANTIKKFLTAGQAPPLDYSFLALGNLNRSIESVDVAVAKLNLDADKMTAALFWFYKGNDITDEPAFDALKTGDIDSALQIWDKQLFTETKENGSRYWNPISEKNYFAFHNYFVASLLSNNSAKISNAISAQLKFLESHFCASFVAKITDRTFKTTTKELQLTFLNEILKEIEQKTINLTLVKLVSILNNNYLVKQDFIKNISRKFTGKITGEIEIACKSRVNKANAAKAGDILYNQTKDDLEQLKIILGVQDYACFNIADKLANEILQCGIDYFEHFKDTDTDPCEHSMKLFILADSMAVGNVAKQSCQKNIMNLHQWNNKKKNILNRLFKIA